MPTSEKTTCQQCGAVLPEDRPGSLCLRCVLEVAVDFDQPRRDTKDATLDDTSSLTREDDDAMEGARIGPYKILQKIGEGGFGVVYMAAQSGAVHRRVALKIIKAGMDTRQVIARFEAERQALAMMDHPNIARVFDAGETETGRPYFVMELVKGIPLSQFCREENLDTTARLHLFIQVCKAVQHAHLKGVIHRDLKPSNVLVTLHDGEAVPKVIDFGIAKAIDQELTDKTLFTRYEQMIGTPAYMSPEQAALSGLDVDTRSDVYSLGVLLYEILTGTTPFDAKTLRDAAFDEMRRIIREEEPPRPSTRLTALRTQEQSGERLAPISVPASEVARDLDWVVMKALEKDRSRRYDTAGGLARDVERYLANEPVEAGAPSLRYKAGKFVRRHRVGVGAAAAVAAALVAGMGLALVGFLQAKAERGRAVEAREAAEEQARLADLARDESEHQASLAKAVSTFMQNDLLAFANPYNTTDTKEVTLREVVDSASAKVNESFAKQPEVRATLHYSLASIYDSLSLHAQAEQHLAESVKTWRETFGEDHPGTLEARAFLALVTSSTQGPAKALEKLKAVEKDQRRVLGADHPETLKTQRAIAVRLNRLGQSEEAEAHLRAIYEKQSASLENDDLEVAETVGQLGRSLFSQGTPQKQEEGIAMAREQVALLANAEDVDEMALDRAQHGLGTMLGQSGRGAEAEKLEREVLERRKRILGDSHDATLVATSNLANTLGNLDKYEESIGLYRGAIAAYEALEEKFPDSELHARYGLGNSLRRSGRPSEALAEYEKVLEAAPEIFGEGHDKLLRIQVMMAECHVMLGNLEKAVRLYEEIVPATKEKVGANHPWTINRSHQLAVYLGELGREQEAESIWIEVCEGAEQCYGKDDPRLAESLSPYAWCLHALKKFAAAIPVMKRVETIYEAEAGKDDLRTKEARLGWLTMRRTARESMTQEEVQEAYQLMGEVHGQTTRQGAGKTQASEPMEPEKEAAQEKAQE